MFTSASLAHNLATAWSTRQRRASCSFQASALRYKHASASHRFVRRLLVAPSRGECLPARSSEQEILSELEDVQPGGIAGYGVISSKPSTPLLDTIQFPSHLKGLSTDQLKQVAKELRADLIYNVSQTGGHLGSSLGVVELTVALNYVFDQPQDKIIWDVGHQAYPHKILTGRRERMNTMRQTGGISPFTKRSESPYDCFGAGHSSTSISAGLGMAVARDMQGGDNPVSYTHLTLPTKA